MDSTHHSTSLTRLDKALLKDVRGQRLAEFEANQVKMLTEVEMQLPVVMGSRMESIQSVKWKEEGKEERERERGRSQSSYLIFSTNNFPTANEGAAKKKVCRQATLSYSSNHLGDCSKQLLR